MNRLTLEEIEREIETVREHGLKFVGENHVMLYLESLRAEWFLSAQFMDEASAEAAQRKEAEAQTEAMRAALALFTTRSEHIIELDGRHTARLTVPMKEYIEAQKIQKTSSSPSALFDELRKLREVVEAAELLSKHGPTAYPPLHLANLRAALARYHK